MKKHRWPKRLICGIVVLALAGVLAFWLLFALPFWGVPFNASRHTRVPLTPAWALECWLWEDDANTAERVLELLDGYEKHDIPVRTVLIDSPWSTRYNDFVVDESRYPNPKEFFLGLQDRGYRVVLWMTCMVNSRNKDTAIQDATDWFEEAKAGKYLVGNGYQWTWWKGRGGFIDYTSPRAMAWWRGLQQDVFDWGIDGWKLDGTATFFSSRLGPLPIPYQRTHRGWMTTRGYMDLYYRLEYRHGLEQNPDFITLARAIDGRAHPEGFAPFDAAPVTWVGDQDHAWSLEEEGLEEAVRYILDSARLGYCIVGSDVAGFGGATIPPNLYIRWAQFSTFCGLFLNGGHGERALWKRTPAELENIRKFAWLHTELVPYIYSHMVQCHQGRSPLIQPQEGTYQYLFGDSFFVAPIYEDSPARTFALPPGHWRYLFEDKTDIPGPITLTWNFPLNEFPVFVRDGAIIPMNVCRAYTGFGTRGSEGHLTLAVYPRGESQFTIHHPDRSGDTTVTVREGPPLHVELTGVGKPHILRVRRDAKPRLVLLDGKVVPEGKGDNAWHYTESDRRLWVRTSRHTTGHYIIQ